MLILFLIIYRTRIHFFLSILDLHLPIGVLCMKYEVTFYRISAFKSPKGLSLGNDVGNKSL